jgi:hypothetical protein
MSFTTTTTSFTLSAGVAQQLFALDTTRTSLLRTNTGATNPATFKFGSGPASATDGVVFAVSSAPVLITGAAITPVDSVWAYSASGTTVTVEVSHEY